MGATFHCFKITMGARLSILLQQVHLQSIFYVGKKVALALLNRLYSIKEFLSESKRHFFVQVKEYLISIEIDLLGT
jgi:hypothetical protein